MYEICCVVLYFVYKILNISHLLILNCYKFNFNYACPQTLSNAHYVSFEMLCIMFLSHSNQPFGLVRSGFVCSPVLVIVGINKTLSMGKFTRIYSIQHRNTWTYNILYYVLYINCQEPTTAVAFVIVLVLSHWLIVLHDCLHLILYGRSGITERRGSVLYENGKDCVVL